MNHRDYSAAGGSVQSYQPSHVQYHHHQPRPQLQLPQCRANGCNKPVHYDPGLPVGLRTFAYCSPQCRDRDLLPLEKANLTAALNDMKRKLQEVATAEKRSPSSSVLQRQPLHESSRPAGSSSFTGVGHVLGGYSLGPNTSSLPKPVGADHHNFGASSFSTSTTSDHQTSGVNGVSSTSVGGGHFLGMMERTIFCYLSII